MPAVALELPRVYPILDVGCLSGAATSRSPARSGFSLAVQDVLAFAAELIAGGATLVQYRNKQGSAREMLSHARELRRIAGEGVTLIMNDRADLCLAAGFDGVHVGQEDLSPEAVRVVVGGKRLVGVSTHNVEQVREADGWPVDYVAIGPVFQTGSKANPDPVIGLEGVRKARALTRKPLVAIGGITLDDARSVVDAGADSVAVISCLLAAPRETMSAFLRLLS